MHRISLEDFTQCRLHTWYNKKQIYTYTFRAWKFDTQKCTNLRQNTVNLAQNSLSGFFTPAGNILHLRRRWQISDMTASGILFNSNNVKSQIQEPRRESILSSNTRSLRLHTISVWYLVSSRMEKQISNPIAVKKKNKWPSNCVPSWYYQLYLYTCTAKERNM